MNKLIPLIAFSILLLVPVGFQEAFAETKTWIGGTGNWNVDANWSPIGVPASGDDIIIDSDTGTNSVVTVDFNFILTGTLTINSGDTLVLNIPVPPNASDDFTNFGIINNFGTIAIGGTTGNADIINKGTINNFNILNIRGGFFNDFDGILNNKGIFDGLAHQGDVTIKGIMKNEGTIIGIRLFDIFDGIINNFGVFHMLVGSELNIGDQRFPNSIINNFCEGILLFEGTVNNFGTINEFPEQCPLTVGGKIIPIETTSLLLASAQTFSWMIPVVLSVLGIGLFVVSRSGNKVG